MDTISLMNTDRLYWLGRYTERVYTTLNGYSKSYDNMIDMDFDSYEQMCSDLDIPNIYRDKDDFIYRYCYDETDPNSIYSNLMRAYDNAVMIREEIGSEPLAYIQLAVYEMNKAKASASPLIELQRVVDNILAFWGIADDLIEDDNVRNIIKVGKRVERIDLYGRIGAKKKDLRREVVRLKGRINETILDFDRYRLQELVSMMDEDNLDYIKIVEDVENLLNKRVS